MAHKTSKPTRLQRLYENAQRNRAVALASYRYGWPIDKVRQADIARQITQRIHEADLSLGELLGDLAEKLAKTKTDRKFFSGFNANSSAQVASLLYHYLEEPIRLRTDQGAPSAGKAALELIANEGCDEAKAIARLIRTRKTATKLQEAYIENLADVTMVRPSAHVTAQVAGRWSYREPALQTVPPPIKPMFVAHPGGWLIACDLSQAELRSMAQQSGDPGMMRAYTEGRDIHKETAAEIFGTTPEQVTKGQRKIAKPLGLGYNYSVLNDEGAAAGLYQQVSHLVQGTLTLTTLLGALKRLDRARPAVRQFKKACLAKAIACDYVEEPLHNRRRYFYGKVKDTEVFNFPHQAMIAAIVDRAIQGIHAEFDPSPSGLHEGLFLQRHDELILGGKNPIRLCQLLWKHMRQTIEIDGRSMLYEIEFLISKRWGQGVAVEPKDGGFTLACNCGWFETAQSLVHAVTNACNHYEQCEKMR